MTQSMTQSPTLPLHDGRTIPQLGYGVWQVDADIAEDVVGQALAAGYRHIDTAMIYGNEEGVGRAIAGSGIPREEIFVTTKLWNEDHGHDSALKAIDASLERLGLEYVDLYLIHWPCPRKGLFPDTYRALETLYREGRVRAIGVSNFQPAQLDRLLQTAEVVPAVNQVELHPWLQQEELRRKHKELGIMTEAWSPLGRGQVLDDPVIKACAEEHGRTPAQVIRRWHMQLGHVAIPKASSEARIRENFDVFCFELSERDMAALAGLERGHRTGSHPDNVN